MIPKIIHYCWFGHSPLPELAVKCIDSWKRLLPDYEIIEWNENNYDINSIPYIAEAYKNKKYAFVSDYARFDILYHHGGVYFDTDVEVLKDITPIIEKGAFVGLEKIGSIATGLGIGFEKGNEVLKDILDSYKNETFILPNGELNLRTVVDRVTEIFIKYGFSNLEELQIVKNVVIYPIEYFCPKNPDTGIINITDNSYTIHHYDGSWLSHNMKILYREKQWLSQHISNRNVKIFFEKLCVLKKVIKDIFIKK